MNQTLPQRNGLRLAHRPKYRPLTPAGRFWLGYLAIVCVVAWWLA